MTTYHPHQRGYPLCPYCGAQTTPSITGFRWCDKHGPVWTPAKIRLEASGDLGRVREVMEAGE
jgi:hypothetical protein